MWADILTGFGFMLILEGVLPFSDPKAWKDLIVKLSGQSESFIRRMGLVSVMLGLMIVYIVRA